MAAVLAVVGAAGLSAQDHWSILERASILATGIPVAAEPVARAADEALEPIPVSVLTAPFPPSGAGAEPVAVLVEVGGPQLVAANPTNELRGAISGRALDSSGRVVDSFEQPFVLMVSGQDAVSTTGLKLFGQLELPPGDYRLEVTASNLQTGATGSAGLALSVPAPGEPRLSPPLFRDVAADWRLFRQSGADDSLAFPFVDHERRPFMPAATAALAPDRVEFSLVGYGVAGDELRALVVDDQGARVPVELSVRAMAAGDAPGQQLLLAAVDEELDSGDYELLVGVDGTDPARWGRSRFSVTTAPAGVDGTAVSPAPSSILAVADGEPAAEPEPEVVLGLAPAEVKAHYREVLALLAGGDDEQAVRDLYALEKGAMPRRKSGEARLLREAELEVIEGLAKGGRDRLLGVIHLHMLVDDFYLSRGDVWNVAQNRIFMTELVDLYSGRRPGDARARIGGQVLAAVGRTGEALELDPDNELALLRLALGHEKAARNAMAVDFLERLLRAHPDNPQAGLRLAVNLRRIGQADAARGMLRRVVEQPLPEWVLGLAYQELASLEYEAGQIYAAEQVLRRGIDQLGLQRLYLQLAFYLDQQRRRDDSIAVLNQMIVDRSLQGESPRHRYNGDPTDELAAARAEIVALARDQLPELGAALGVTARAR